MKTKFTYEFEEDRSNSLTYELSMDEDEIMEYHVDNGIPALYMNRSAMLTLAKLLIKLSYGRYSESFHIHLRKNFSSEGPDAITLALYSGNQIKPEI